MLVKCFCIIYTDGDQRAKRGGHPMIMTPHILIEWAYLYILEVTIISWKPSHCYIMQREIVKHKIIIRDTSQGVNISWSIYSIIFEKMCKRRVPFCFIGPWNHPNLNHEWNLTTRATSQSKATQMDSWPRHCQGVTIDWAITLCPACGPQSHCSCIER